MNARDSLLQPERARSERRSTERIRGVHGDLDTVPLPAVEAAVEARIEPEAGRGPPGGVVI